MIIDNIRQDIPLLSVMRSVIGWFTTEELVQIIMSTDVEKPGIPGNEEEPPSSAEDIPLSKTGALLLYAAQIGRAHV